MIILFTKRKIFVAFYAILNNIIVNSTPHASRKNCAPWGVIFFQGAGNAIY